MSGRIVALCLALALVFSLSACGEAPGEKPLDGPAVTDGAGRTLEIPAEPEAELIASVYGTAVPFLVALGLTERVVAVNCKSNFWKKADDNLAAAGTVGRGVVDLEALAASGATVLVHRSNDAETVEAVEKLGLDVLCIRAEDMEGIYATLSLLGEYFGRQERAAEVVAWMDGKFAQIDAITAGIPQAERPTALMMGGEPGRVASGDMLQSWLIEKAGGVPVAAEVENDANWINVGLETVFQWDPDYLFCTSSASLEYTVDELMEDAAWSDMKAVKNARVAIVPARLDTWDMPGINCVLGAFWMLRQMYPERFGLDELRSEIDEYYTFMFGQTFEVDYLGYEIK